MKKPKIGRLVRFTQEFPEVREITGKVETLMSVQFTVRDKKYGGIKYVMYKDDWQYANGGDK